MRKILISVAAAATALAFASPASAQYYPQPRQQPYGNAYGYNNNYGQARALQARIDAVQQQIRQLDRRNVVRDGSAGRLKNESRDIERRLRAVGRNGLNGYEASNISTRIAQLEQRVQYAMANRYARGGNGRGYGHDNGNHDNGNHGRDHYDRDR